jgi:hypothetical protein
MMTDNTDGAAPTGPRTPATAKAEKVAKAPKAKAAAKPRASRAKGKTVAKAATGRGPGRPPKPRKPGRDYVVTYLAASVGNGVLPKSRRVFATDPSEAITEAHRLNRITHTHCFNCKAQPVDGDVEEGIDDPIVDENGVAVEDHAENIDDGDEQ